MNRSYDPGDTAEMDVSKYRKRLDRARWMEILLPIVASVLSSAIVVSWTVSATISSITEKVADHDRRIRTVEGYFPASTVDLATLKARQDGDDRLHVEEASRLARIESKIDSITERLGRAR